MIPRKLECIKNHCQIYPSWYKDAFPEMDFHKYCKKQNYQITPYNYSPPVKLRSKFVRYVSSSTQCQNRVKMVFSGYVKDIYFYMLNQEELENITITAYSNYIPSELKKLKNNIYKLSVCIGMRFINFDKVDNCWLNFIYKNNNCYITKFEHFYYQECYIIYPQIGNTDNPVSYLFDKINEEKVLFTDYLGNCNNEMKKRCEIPLYYEIGYYNDKEYLDTITSDKSKDTETINF